MSEKIEQLLTEFDEMGYTPTTLCSDPDAAARDWKARLICTIHQIERVLKTDLENAERLIEQLRSDNINAECKLMSLKKQLKEVRKETAKEILGTIITAGTIDGEWAQKDTIKQLAKKYGVEIEE